MFSCIYYIANCESSANSKARDIFSFFYHHSDVEGMSYTEAHVDTGLNKIVREQVISKWILETWYQSWWKTTLLGILVFAGVVYKWYLVL